MTVGQGLEPSRTAGGASVYNHRAVAEAGRTGDEADTIKEQQQIEADATAISAAAAESGECDRGAVAEADAIWEQ